MLVCDMSGTIIKENDIVYNNLFKTIKTIEPNVTKYDIKKFYGCGKHEILKFFINKKYNNDEEKKIIFKEYNMKYNDLIKNDYKNNNNIELIHPKLINYFNHLRQNDIKISLNTEYSKEIQEILIDKFKLYKCVDDYISSEETNYNRFKPNMINILMKRNFIFFPNQVVKIGDSCIDIIEGKKANTHTIGVLTGSTSKELLREYNPTFILNNIMDIRI